MAVDTRDKRFSMLGLMQAVPFVMPNPDGQIGARDRLQGVRAYFGVIIIANNGFLSGALVIYPALNGRLTSRVS